MTPELIEDLAHSYLIEHRRTPTRVHLTPEELDDINEYFGGTLPKFKFNDTLSGMIIRKRVWGIASVSD